MDETRGGLDRYRCLAWLVAPAVVCSVLLVAARLAPYFYRGPDGGTNVLESLVLMGILAWWAWPIALFLVVPPLANALSRWDDDYSITAKGQ